MKVLPYCRLVYIHDCYDMWILGFLQNTKVEGTPYKGITWGDTPYKGITWGVDYGISARGQCDDKTPDVNSQQP